MLIRTNMEQKNKTTMWITSKTCFKFTMLLLCNTNSILLHVYIQESHFKTLHIISDLKEVFCNNFISDLIFISHNDLEDDHFR